MRLKNISLFLSILLVLLTACAPNANSDQAGTTSKDTLIIAIPADQGTLDPAVSMTNSAWKITYPAYQRLVQYDGATTNVKPDLAKSWTVSEDGLRWTFTLNEGHAFADGTPVDASAVKFSFERVLKIGKAPSEVYRVIQEIQVVDPMTVTFVLKHPFPPFLSTLATNYGGIVNPNVMKYEKNGDMGQNYLANHTMGSGPYELTEWKKGQYIKLSLQPKSKITPPIKNVYFKIVVDSSAQRLQLEKGEIDIAEGIPIEQIDSVKRLKNVQLVQQPSLQVDYLYINTSKGNPALKNPKVRQALSYAIDYEALMEAVQQGYAKQMRGPIPQGMWGYDPQAKQYKRDVKKAKALLQEAGISNLTLDLLYSDNKPWWETEALTIQANLAEIGVRVNLKKVAYVTMREMIDQGKFDLCTGVWSPDYGDPYMFMNNWFDSNNFGLAGNRAFYQNDRVDQLIRKAATITNQAEREKLYQNAQQIVIEEAPYIYLYQKDFLLPMNKEVKGFVYNPMLDGMYNISEMSK